MFKGKRLFADVATELDLKANMVLDFYIDYLGLLE
jgi:hypothetical protein